MSRPTPQLFFTLSSFAHKELFTSCDLVWEALGQIEKYILKQSNGKIEGDVSDGAYLVKPELIFIGKGAVVEPGAYIRGPCIIGENTVVRHGAYVRGNVITGNGCVIGHATEVKNSIFLDGAAAAHFAYVGDTILGNRVNLGAGTKCANLKLNRELISARFEEKRYNTYLRKFGAIVGDESELGCNSVTSPGALIGKRALCYPCITISGHIPDGMVVKDLSSVQTLRESPVR